MSNTGEWFEGEVRSLLPQLYGAARRLTRAREDAEDLVAEAIARAWEHRHGLNDRARFRGWLFRILTNTYLAQRRTDLAAPVTEPLSDDAQAESFSLFERLHQPFLMWWGNPEKEFLRRLVRADFETALDALPDAYRVVVVLADVQEMAYADIADLLGIPIGTVRSRLSRGRSLLQRSLWEHAADAGLVGAAAVSAGANASAAAATSGKRPRETHP